MRIGMWPKTHKWVLTKPHMELELIDMAGPEKKEPKQPPEDIWKRIREEKEAEKLAKETQREIVRRAAKKDFGQGKRKKRT